ncbi:MAG: 50S ribosomal protein L10 [Candidatus Falkowbacteria bacterium]
MAITKNKKKEIVRDLEKKLARAKSIVFTKYFGVNANDINNLRSKFRESGSEYIVSKKTLMDIALEKTDIKGKKIKDLKGEVAVILGYEDEVAPARILSDFAKEHESMEVLGGVLENKFIDAAKVKALAQLPSKQELYAKLVGSIKAPVSGFVNVLSGNLRGLVTVLKAIEDKK